MDTRALATWKKLWEGAPWENGPMFRWSMSDLRNPAVTDWERWTSCFLRKKMIQKKCTQGFAGAVICWVVYSFAMHSNTSTSSLHQNRKVTRLVMNLLHARHHLNIHYQKHNPFENGSRSLAAPTKFFLDPKRKTEEKPPVPNLRDDICMPKRWEGRASLALQMTLSMLHHRSSVNSFCLWN